MGAKLWAGGYIFIQHVIRISALRCILWGWLFPLKRGGAGRVWHTVQLLLWHRYMDTWTLQMDNTNAQITRAGVSAANVFCCCVADILAIFPAQNSLEMYAQEKTVSKRLTPRVYFSGARRAFGMCGMSLYGMHTAQALCLTSCLHTMQHKSRWRGRFVC